ncbi:superoxide dismutase family protein [Deinococcus sp. UYEF24]
MRRSFLSGLLALGLASAGGARADIATPLSASATLRDPVGAVSGTVTFKQVGVDVKITVKATGLTPGQHGIHIHEYGRCTPGIDATRNEVVAFGGAGGHFDPGMSHNHAGPAADDSSGHGGDLPMLMVGADGTGTASFMTSKVSLTGVTGMLNRSIVVHAMSDDYKTDPSGLSGARERCGVIVRDNFTVRDYLLPGAQDYPEGLAYDAARRLIFTGSAKTGDIYAIDADSGKTTLFSEGGAQGRSSALGLKVDAQGRLWVAGGATGAVSVLSRDGAPVATLTTPSSPNPYLNDLIPTPDGSVYVTDSVRPVIWQVRDMKIDAWLDLTATPIKYGPGINLNGVVATPDGHYLLTIQLNTGELWRIDTRTKAVIKIMAGLVHGDGLLLDGHTLYVGRNADQVIAKVGLNTDYSSGKLVAEEPLGGLRYPSTLIMLGNDLVSTQSQLDKLQGGTPETPFRLTRFRKF